jgi:hypothetical protein
VALRELGAWATAARQVKLGRSHADNLRMHPVTDTALLAIGDHVRTPDGRIGEVIGFYLRESESVLLKFTSCGCQEFPVASVTALLK